MRLVIDVDLSKIANSIESLVSKFKIGHLLLLSFALHLFTIPFPSDDFVQDEVYWVISSRQTLLMQPASIEHPPLVRIMIAISMKIFGDYWFAWRFPIVLTAIGSLYVFYLIAKRFVGERYALFGTALLSFDVLFFVFGSILYLDMPAILFGLLGMELYFAKRYNWSGLSFGISFLMKELGLLFLAVVLIYHIATQLKLERFRNKVNLKKFLTFFMILLLVAGCGLWIYDILFHPASNFVSTQVRSVQYYDQNGNPVGKPVIQINNLTRGTPITTPVQNVILMMTFYRSNTAICGPGGIHCIQVGMGYKPPWSWIMPIDNSLVPVDYYYVASTANGIIKGGQSATLATHFLLGTFLLPGKWK